MSGELWLVRHGETEWSRSGQHTGRTDIPLTPAGEQAATAMRAGLAEPTFAQVITSPLSRARETARLAGFGDAEVVDDLAEWDYGAYEGRTTPELRDEIPGWSIWTHGVVDGESAQQVGERLDRVVDRARSVDGDTLAFAHGHSLCALAARWLGLPVSEGRLFRLQTTTVSVLGTFHDAPVVLRWSSALHGRPEPGTPAGPPRLTP